MYKIAVICIVTLLVFVPVIAQAGTNAGIVTSISLERILLFCGLFSYLVTLFTWWRAAEGKKFAAEQSHSQLLRNQEEIVKQVNVILECVDRHERKTFENFQATTNEIHRKLDTLQTQNQTLLVQISAANTSIANRREN